MALFDNINKIDKILHARNYLITMTIYHILAIVIFIKGIEGFKLQTLVGIDQSLIARSSSIFEILQSGKGLMSTLTIITIIIGIDLAFLLILGYDFKKLNLTWNKIYIIEGIIFIIALFVPIFRALLLFFSLNTIQIFVLYHLSTMFDKWKFYLLRYAIVLGGYILLAKILIFSLTNMVL